MEPQVRRGKDTMDIVTTDGETSDRGGGGVHYSQGRGGQDAAATNSAISLDLTGNMAVGISTGGTSEDGEGKRKGCTEGAAQSSARAAEGHTITSASSGFNHRGFTGSRQGQGGLGSPHAVVPPNEGKTPPPDQGGTGTSASREVRDIHM